VLHGRWWTLPFRWLIIDLIYAVHAWKHGDKVSRRPLRRSLQMLGILVLVCGALIYAGYGLELLMLWFIPSRLIFLTLGFSFFWLPHVPHDVTQEDNFTQATTVREGHEWLFNPALQYQNFHLIHHMYPTTPFYNNGKVWLLLEKQLRTRDLAIQHGFAIQPRIYKAATGAAPEAPASLR
jgi:beta-carotene hydroxylase